MTPVRSPSIRLTRTPRVSFAFATSLLAAGMAFGQAVSTYLPPEVFQHGNEPRHSLFQLGMFDLNPHVAVSTIYDDNITLHSNTNQDDFIFIFSPGFDILKRDAEDTVISTRLTYNPALVLFTDHSTYNSLDHFVHWTGGARLARLNVSLAQDYESSSGGVVDVGDRVNQEYYFSSARVSYEISEKTTAEISGTYRIRDYESLVSSTEWIEDNAVHYQISPKVRVGLGISVGQLEVGETPQRLYRALTNGFGGRFVTVTKKGNTQTFVTPSVRAAYRTTEKTDVALSVGGEWRTYEDGHERFGPVFTLAGTYTPWEQTSLSIEGHRREQNSAVLGGQDYITTGISVAANHRFRERYRAHVQFTYDNAEYQAAARRNLDAGRVDDYFLLRSGVDAILASSWTVGLFHEYRVNDSNSGFSFDNQQVGIQTVWAY